MKIFIGKNYEWKIGDMDQILNGNFLISSEKGGFMNKLL